MTSSDMNSSTYRTLERKQLDPNYMSVKFHDYSISRLEFRDHSSHPNLSEKKLKSQKNRPNPRTELMGVPLNDVIMLWMFDELVTSSLLMVARLTSRHEFFTLRPF